MMTPKRFETAITDSRLLAPVLQNWDSIQLKNCWLVAGCIAQTLWNNKFGFPPDHGISDLDLVYHDPNDLSEDAEQQHAERIQQSFSHVPVWLDVKNEARIHLWYEGKFGYSIPPYQSAEAAISTFPMTATAVGIRPRGNELEVYAPFGLDDLMNGVVRANKAQITQEIFEAKVAKWLRTWPDLTVVSWDAEN